MVNLKDIINVTFNNSFFLIIFGFTFPSIQTIIHQKTVNDQLFALISYLCIVVCPLLSFFIAKCSYNCKTIYKDRFTFILAVMTILIIANKIVGLPYFYLNYISGCVFALITFVTIYAFVFQEDNVVFDKYETIYYLRDFFKTCPYIKIKIGFFNKVMFSLNDIPVDKESIVLNNKKFDKNKVLEYLYYTDKKLDTLTKEDIATLDMYSIK